MGLNAFDINFSPFFLLYSVHDTLGMLLIPTRMWTLGKILSNGGIQAQIRHNLAAVEIFEVLSRKKKFEIFDRKWWDFGIFKNWKKCSKISIGARFWMIWPRMPPLEGILSKVCLINLLKAFPAKNNKK